MKEHENRDQFRSLGVFAPSWLSRVGAPRGPGREGRTEEKLQKQRAPRWGDPDYAGRCAGARHGRHAAGAGSQLPASSKKKKTKNVLTEKKNYQSGASGRRADKPRRRTTPSSNIRGRHTGAGSCGGRWAAQFSPGRRNWLEPRQRRPIKSLAHSSKPAGRPGGRRKQRPKPRKA